LMLANDIFEGVTHQGIPKLSHLHADFGAVFSYFSDRKQGENTARLPNETRPS